MPDLSPSREKLLASMLAMYPGENRGPLCMALAAATLAMPRRWPRDPILALVVIADELLELKASISRIDNEKWRETVKDVERAATKAAESASDAITALGLLADEDLIQLIRDRARSPERYGPDLVPDTVKIDA